MSDYSFPKRKPVDWNQVSLIVTRIVRGSVDSSEFGGIVWGVRKSSGTPFLIVKHTASKKHNATFTAIRCTKNVANAVLDAIPNHTQNVVAYPERY